MVMLEVTKQPINTEIVRLNCLLLAVQDNSPYKKVDLAKEFYNWVMEGKVPNDSAVS